MKIHHIYKRIPRSQPAPVRNFRTYKDGFTYAVCPRCKISMEREYVHYCNNCGQKLDWKGYMRIDRKYMNVYTAQRNHFDGQS